MSHLLKGNRVRFSYFRPYQASLAGVQPKLAVEEIVGEGVVEHIRSDKPDGTGTIIVWVRDDEGKEHKIAPHWITEIL
jgi:hypothetical protein